MMQTLLRLGIALSILVSPLAAAQEPPIPQGSPQEFIELTVGDIFEVQPVSQILNPQYAWILTQDRAFLQSAQTSVFRVRLIQPGNYMLNAMITSADGTQRIARSFGVNVKARESGQVDDVGYIGSGSGKLVTTAPAMNSNDWVVLAPNTQLLRLTPLSRDIVPLSLDADINRDTNGDGDTRNDTDDEGTFFQSDATMLHLWFAQDVQSQTMQITGLTREGTPVTQTIQVASDAYAKSQGLFVSPVSIKVSAMDGTTLAFEGILQSTLPPGTPVLYHWQFGDGTESLLTTPTHTYGVAGTYDVTLKIRNLLTGQQVATASQSVTVDGQGGGSVTSAASSEQTQEPTEPTTTGGWSFGSILIILGLFLVSVIIGIGIIAVYKKLRKTPLSATLDAMEANVMKTETPAVQSTPPLVIPTPAPVQAKPVAPEVSKPTTPNSSIPSISSIPSTSPSPQVQQPKPTPVSTPTSDAPVPTWLKQSTPAPVAQQTPVPPKPATPAPQAPKSAPVPAPQPKPVMPVQPKPAPTPAPAPKPMTPPPVQAPKPLMPVQPKPAPTPAPQPVQPKPVPPAPLVPKPVTPQAPAAPVQPKPESTPVPKQEPKDIPLQEDKPIGFIRAESLEKKPEPPANPQA